MNSTLWGEKLQKIKFRRTVLWLEKGSMLSFIKQASHNLIIFFSSCSESKFYQKDVINIGCYFIVIFDWRHFFCYFITTKHRNMK